ncbi:hypothetical protein Tco_0544509, partial [Tanacetum coccineum]
ERAQHKREYDSWVNERQIQTTEDKVDTSSRSRNDAHADDADIRPIYDEEPMVLRHKRLLKSMYLLQDNSILSNLNLTIKERLTRILNNVMTHVLCLLM